MSLRTLRRHSSSLVRARAPQNGHNNGHGNGPPDFVHGGGGGPGNGNGHGHGFGNDKDHKPGNNGNGHGNGNQPDNQPTDPPPSGGGSDPGPGGESNVGAGNDGGGQGSPPSPDNHESGGSGGGNTGGNSGGTTNPGTNPPVDTSGGSTSTTSFSDPQASSTSRDTASQTSDRVTASSPIPLINAQTLEMTASVPSVSADIVSGGNPSALSTPAFTPSPNPSPSPSNEVASEAALSRHDNGGAIAGGVVGAVVFVALAVGIWIVYKRRRKNRLAPSAEYFSNPSAYPFARGYGGTSNRSEINNPLGSNYGGAGTGAAGNANLKSFFSSESEINPQMEQYRDERPVYSSEPLDPPPQPEILYSTRPPGSPPAVPTPGSMPGTPTTPNGRRIPFGTGTFQFPPRPPHPQQLISSQPQ